MKMRFIAILALVLAAPSAQARLWKPTPLQIAQDYTVIIHNKSPDGVVVVQWMAPTTITAPIMQEILDKYVVLNVSRTLPTPAGIMAWQDVVGVEAHDASGAALKAVPDEALPPSLVGFTAQINAANRQSSQGASKAKLLVFEAGNVNACTKGGLQISYEGELYTFDTPMPGCAKQ